jgi:hypothetical protein
VRQINVKTFRSEKLISDWQYASGKKNPENKNSVQKSSD